MTEARIRSSPDQELQFRSQKVTANNKTIQTPIKTIDYSKIDPSVNLNKSVEYVNELYSGLSKKKILGGITESDKSLVYYLNAAQKI